MVFKYKTLIKSFNDLFALIGAKLDNLIPTTHEDPLKFLGLWQDGLHSISTLSNESSTLTHCLSRVYFQKLKYNLFNANLLEGCFPGNSKPARIIPIHKAGDCKNVNDYRPISTLPLLYKIFEKPIYSRLYPYIINYDTYLVNNQFVFRFNRNTADAVLQFLDYVYDGKLYFSYIYT